MITWESLPLFNFNLIFLITTLVTIITFSFILKQKFIYKVFKPRIRERDIHSTFKPKVGGLVIIPLFNLSLILLHIFGLMYLNSSLVGVMIGSFFVFVYGFLDEKYDLSWKYQLIIQIIIALTLVFFGITIKSVMLPYGEILFFDQMKLSLFSTDIYFLQVILTVFWIVGLMNVLNWLDGLDGLAGGVGVIGFIILFVLSITTFVNQINIAYLSIVLAGLYLGFLFFNFYPSKIFLGTLGSMFLGYILGSLSIISGGKMATISLVLAFPIIDACIVIIQRILANQSIFKADNRHFHYKLLQIGISQKKSVIIMYGISLIFGLSALFFKTNGKIGIFSIGIIFLFLYSFRFFKK